MAKHNTLNVKEDGNKSVGIDEVGGGASGSFSGGFRGCLVADFAGFEAVFG